MEPLCTRERQLERYQVLTSIIANRGVRSSRERYNYLYHLYLRDTPSRIVTGLTGPPSPFLPSFLRFEGSRSIYTSSSRWVDKFWDDWKTATMRRVRERGGD